MPAFRPGLQPGFFSGGGNDGILYTAPAPYAPPHSKSLI